MNFRDAPIKRKLMAVIMLASTVVVFLTASAFFAYEVVTVRKNVVESAVTLAQVTAAESSAALHFEDESTAEEILSRLQAKTTVTAAALYLNNGTNLAHYPASAPLASFPSAVPEEEFVRESHALGVYVPVLMGNHIIGHLYLRWDLHNTYRRFLWYIALVAVILAGSLAIALWLATWLQQRVARPIQELAQAAHAVFAKKDYRIRAQKFGNDEMGVLTDAFNHMLEDIHQRDAALRENEAELVRALKAAEAYAAEVRALNAALEERVAKRTAELAATNRELEAFSYSVSHDLRAPLRHIDAYAGMLADESGSNAPASVRKYIQRIRDGVQNMGRLVDDLLNLSRVGRADIKSEPVNLNDLVRQVIGELKSDVAGREIEWRVGALPTVSGDAGLLKQVFANLLGNSIKYTRPRPRAVIEVGLETAEGAPAVFVRDNGVGFNMQYADKLFGVFQRLHREEEFEGTGVGLATVRRIIQLHGGKIWVNAELDKGATFHFTLRGLEAA